MELSLLFFWANFLLGYLQIPEVTKSDSLSRVSACLLGLEEQELETRACQEVGSFCTPTFWVGAPKGCSLGTE